MSKTFQLDQDGNTRGVNAIDLQVTRANVTEVASGEAAVVLGGQNNTASGDFAVASGDNTVASGLGAHTAGKAVDYGGRTSSILASGLGAFTIGYAYPSLSGQDATISATAVGAFAVGQAEGGTISATAIGAKAVGYTHSSGYFPYTNAEILAQGNGSFAGGYAYAIDSYAMTVLTDASITAQGNGSFASGYVKNQRNSSVFAGASYSYIKAMSSSLAMGFINSDDSYKCYINAQTGSAAFGHITAGDASSHTIKATLGSFASGKQGSDVGDCIIQATNGSFALGYQYSRGVAPYYGYVYTIISASGAGSVAIGKTDSYAYAFPYSADSRILGSGAGSFAQGYSKAYSHQVCYYANSYITASGAGSHSGGYAYAGGIYGPGIARITSGGTGSFAQGHCKAYAHAGGLASNAVISANGDGSFAQGYMGHSYSFSLGYGYIRAIGKGSFANGYCMDLADIHAQGKGSKAHGYARGMNANNNAAYPVPGIIWASGLGATAMGYAYGLYVAANYSGEAKIKAQGVGSFAGGWAQTDVLSGICDSLIQATGSGSFAHGAAKANYAASDSTIIATSPGSFAHGYVTYGGQITATGLGAMAGGNSVGYPYHIGANGNGAFAWGSAVTGVIQATGINAFQFGQGTNTIANSVKIGAGGLRFRQVAADYSLSAANGDMWVYNNDVYVFTGGAAKNMSNI